MDFIVGLIIFAITVTIHEVSHGYVAYLCGDATAKNAGRLTLNPLKHIDPFWTVIVPFILLVVHSPILFGMAKPVPVNFMMLRNPKRDMILVAAAGPAANILMAIALIYVYKLTGIAVLIYLIMLNLLLAFFNLIPIPPLDGGRILAGFLPSHLAYKFGRIEPYGIFIVVFLLMTGIAQRFLTWCLGAFLHFFG
jgi:Zn-dependent protease